MADSPPCHTSVWGGGSADRVQWFRASAEVAKSPALRLPLFPSAPVIAGSRLLSTQGAFRYHSCGICEADTCFWDQ